MKLHEKIFFYRKKYGLSQETLAEKIGVSRQAVSKWETGDALPEITKLKSLADLFGVTVDFLLNDEETEYKPYYKNSSDKTSIMDQFDSWLEALPEKLEPFLKKHGWIGGIILIIFGIYTTVIRIIGCITAFTVGGKFGGIGMGGFVIPVILSSIISVLVGIAIIAGGVFIVKKFKPKK